MPTPLGGQHLAGRRVTVLAGSTCGFLHDIA
jgi:hypothetical protein